MGIKRKRGTFSVGETVCTSTELQSKSTEKSCAIAGYSTQCDSLPFVENPTGDELKREVELYEKLASEDELQRIAAAKSIISGLFQKPVSEQILLRHLERRLFRGLASGRKGARLGFSIVLAEILSQIFRHDSKLTQNKYAGLLLEKLFLLLKAKTKPEGDLTAQEAKDHVLGLLFGLQCFVRARILFYNTEDWKLVLDEILNLFKKKPWIRQECGWMIVEALEQMDQDQAMITLNTLCHYGLSKSPEGVGIWMVVRDKLSSSQLESLPKAWGNNANPLDQLQNLAKVLRESSELDKNNQNMDENQLAKKKGNWNAKLHFVWDIILKHFIAMLEKDETGYATKFDEFWRVTVDENLFASNASRERKFWGFQVFQKVLEENEKISAVISSIFSRNLMRCIINHSQDKDRFLHLAAEKSLTSVINAARKNTQLLPVILLGLINGNGVYNFDKITKTKTICKLLSLVSKDNCEKVIIVLKTMGNNFYENDQKITVSQVESKRLMLADYLLQIIKKKSVITTEKGRKSAEAVILKTLTTLSYSENNGMNPPISEKSRVMFQNRLMSAFTHILTDIGKYKYICDLFKTNEFGGVRMDSSIQDVNTSARSKLSKILKKLKICSSENKVALQALGLLYALIIFQLYNGEPEAVLCLNDLDLCYHKFVRKKVEISKGEVLDVLVELLLSLISRPSALMRKVAHFVFQAFVSHVTEAGLKLMTDILTTSESLRGQKILFDEEDEPDMRSSQDEIDQDSDVEVVDLSTKQNLLRAGENSKNSITNKAEDSNIQNNEITTDEEAEKLNTALDKVLYPKPNVTNESDDSDADMTDSEMLALDDKLVEVFFQHKRTTEKKTAQKDAKEKICNFKSRILDLIEIYVKKQAHNHLAFDLILPLLTLMQITKAKSLADRSFAIIQIFAKTYKIHNLSPQETMNVNHRIKLLKKIHKLASKDHSNAFCKAASSASLLVISSLYRVNTELVKEAANIYCDTQVKWVLGKANIHAAFFTEWINWCQSHVLDVRVKA